MDTIRVLVLSGGGGRGAFHAGVYKYLMQPNKSGVDSSHIDVWEPHVVVGTSIGAVNGAAIVQGMSAEDLERVWLSLEERDVQGLPPYMRGLARWLARRIFAEIIDARLPQVPKQDSTSPEPDDFWPPLPLLPRWLGERLIGRWINLLDTGPLRKTLFTKFGLDEQKLAESDKALLISATNVQTGERMIFSNREVYQRGTGETRPDVAAGITANRILASCSIPLVYPWTYDSGTNAYYWDGALVANTPLGAALDAVGDVPVNVKAEVVVVLMTPWIKDSTSVRDMPKSFGDAITWTLDWTLLASFRERLHLIDAYNNLAKRLPEEEKEKYQYRDVDVVIVAPEKFLKVGRIIDYDEDVSAKLIEAGRRAAEQAFQGEFS